MQNFSRRQPELTTRLYAEPISAPRLRRRQTLTSAQRFIPR